MSNHNLREQQLIEPGAKLSGPGGFSYFGRSLSVAGDINGDGYSDVIVGSPYYSSSRGAVFVYHGGPSGLSTAASKVLNGPAEGSQFGIAVAGAGDVNGDGFSDIIVGTYISQDDGAPVIGSAYVYLGSAGGIIDTPANVLLGTPSGFTGTTTLAGLGDINHDGFSDVMVGRSVVSGVSKVYVFLGSSTGLQNTPSANIQMPGDNIAFGNAMAGAGDINGDGYDDVLVSGLDNSTATGSVYLFLGGSLGLSQTPATTLTGNANSFFGCSISGAGDINGDGFGDIVIGDYQYDSGRGAAFVYLGDASGIFAIPSTTLTGFSTYGSFGSSVASAGDENADGYADIVIGAGNFLYDEGTSHAYIFHGSEGGFQEDVQDLVGPAKSSAFGSVVSPAGDVNGDGRTDILIGAFLEDMESGAAYVYLGNTGTISSDPANTFIEPVVNSFFTLRNSGAGDLNGDGFSDVAIGASEHASNDGIVYIYYGSASGLPQSPSITLASPATYSQFGSSVGSAGDVNGDGYGDLIVGAPGFNNFFGAAFVYHGGPNGLITTPARILTDQYWMSYNYGRAVAGAGDVNGDGYADVMVGDPGADQVFVHMGSPTGISQAVAVTLSRGGGGSFGGSVANAGDLNGDGFGDVVIGDYEYDFNRGAAYVYYGGIGGLSSTNTTMLKGVAANGLFGMSVSNAGDTNADGFTDIVVGAPNANAVAIFPGGPGGVSQNDMRQLISSVAYSSFGSSLSCAGDVNGDGYSDVVIGAWGKSTGAAHVYLGGMQGLSNEPDVTLNGTSSMFFFGHSVAGVGDVNGDGYSDIMSASLEYSANQMVSQLFNGNNRGKHSHVFTLYNKDLSTPLNHENVSQDQFGVGLFVSPLSGSRQARLVWETKHNGQAFSSSSPITNYTGFDGSNDVWTDIPGSGEILKAMITKSEGKTTKIRVRVQYKSSELPSGQVFGPWIYPQDYINGLLGQKGNPLPVSLITFEVIREGNSANLTWETAWEINSKTFEIEHSVDGRQWKTIGSVAAMQSTSHTSRFSFNHSMPSPGQNFYRLKMIDNDDSFAFSAIRKLNSPNGFEVNVFPNPSSDIVRITASNDFRDKELQSLTVYNVLGIKVQCTYRVINNGFEISGLPAGTYVFRALLGSSDPATGNFVISR
nr:FG-GAP-like repeat-containing protein [uncultured Dyadobacter sp.]